MIFTSRGRMAGIADKFPQIGNLMANIKTRTTQNSLILGLLIGVLAILLVWHMFR